MSRVSKFFGKITTNLKTTVVRFPVVITLLVCIAAIVSLLIEDTYNDSRQLLTRMVFAGVFGAFFGTAAQFISERYEKILRFTWALRAVTLVAAVLYFFLMTTPEKMDGYMVIRLVVCCFALLALYLFLPSTKDAADFNKTSLVHFKSAFTALLYGVVLFLGLLAIYYAIDLLLVKLDDDIPGHIASAVFIFFTPLYYLSLLPNFNAKDDTQRARSEAAASYPRFLDILVSYIAIPLITVFTAVLVAYFVKIVFTLKWPVGQIGPMVLSYSAAGLFIYILSGSLKNSFAVLFRKWYPIALIPLVCLQFVSVFIRLNAYGVTESRYYVTLFGIFSITCAIYLLASKRKKPGMIALLAACFAIFSILPPVDAFTISRVSQTFRVERILVSNGMLNDNKLTPKADIANEDKREITSIINYMTEMGHLNKLSWLPQEYREDRKIYNGFVQLFGFEAYYAGSIPGEIPNFVNASLEFGTSLDIAGYETLFRMNMYSDVVVEEQATSFMVGGKSYKIAKTPTSKGEIVLTVFDDKGQSILDIPTRELFASIAEKSSEAKYQLPPEDMTLDVQGETLRIRLIFENFSAERDESGELTRMSGSAYVLVGTK